MKNLGFLLNRKVLTNSINAVVYSVLSSSGTQCGLWVVTVDPLHFLAGCRHMRLNQVLSVLYLSLFLLCCLLGPFYVFLVFIGVCSVFWLFWLNCRYMPRNNTP